MNDNLSSKKCSMCVEAVAALEAPRRQELLSQLSDWAIVEDHHLRREYSFKNFKKTLEFVNKVGSIAEEEGHHPNISFTWGKASIEIFTHKVDGLTEADFVLAAKINMIE